jgi:transcriptional regulator CtsR
MKESKRGSGGKQRSTKVHNFEEVSLPINCLRFVHKELSTENIDKLFVLCFGVNCNDRLLQI